MLPGMDIAAITGSLSSLFKSELGGVLLNIFRTLLEFFSPSNAPGAEDVPLPDTQA
ncbi:hypothetical protein COJE103337_05515 [Corynebacterium jeikeium]|jgi:hypothetical protein|uniref:Uncharacterized protein n=2 Tax=Corynebacterium jeikeium TaxID=38289 RepID=Q4JY56_CORJK|nr:hypothetical protein HMPREF0297_1130 [Corynebacterium jeikeium ATCC 43734]WCZ52647.1 hypothetical protein CJEIK_00510 [Corynebacterium jeikeium]CAI36251.1 hypothetical protein jk0099 [Corynebacterium jeikeium K411]SCX00318.1 hypothetical protein CJBVI_0076 [Corynebacterium jeikeium]SUY82047.1 Uncharacterised protein [Corynebacterium jeikeium]